MQRMSRIRDSCRLQHLYESTLIAATLPFASAALTRQAKRTILPEWSPLASHGGRVSGGCFRCTGLARTVPDEYLTVLRRFREAMSGQLCVRGSDDSGRGLIAVR